MADRESIMKSIEHTETPFPPVLYKTIKCKSTSWIPPIFTP